MSVHSTCNTKTKTHLACKSHDDVTLMKNSHADQTNQVLAIEKKLETHMTCEWPMFVSCLANIYCIISMVVCLWCFFWFAYVSTHEMKLWPNSFSVTDSIFSHISASEKREYEEGVMVRIKMIANEIDAFPSIPFLLIKSQTPSLCVHIYAIFFDRFCCFRVRLLRTLSEDLLVVKANTLHGMNILLSWCVSWFAMEVNGSAPIGHRHRPLWCMWCNNSNLKKVICTKWNFLFTLNRIFWRVC